MSLSWQLEQYLREIVDAAGTPDGDIKIPVELLKSVAKLAYNDGQLSMAYDALEKLRIANKRRREDFNRIVESKIDEAELPEGS